MHRRRGALGASALALALLTGCTDPAETPVPGGEPSAAPSPSPSAEADTSPSAAPSASDSSQERLGVTSAGLVPLGEGEEVAELETPWGLTTLEEGGGVLVSERDTGEVLLIRDGDTRSVGTVPGVEHGGEGGLLGIALDPEEEELYAYHTTRGGNKVVRMSWDGNEIGPPQDVVTGIPAGGIHNGGRITFGPDGKLYVGTGDAANPENSQDPDSLGGKVLRVNPDGSVPQDNPTGSLVYTLGHRNVQGLAFDSTGRLWASELGQNDQDELNLLQPGANYGWPEVEGEGGEPEYTDPLLTWTPAEASPSGVAILDDTLYMAALRGRRLWQVELTEDGVGEYRALLEGEHGRLRHVEVDGNDGLWVLSNGDGDGGKLLRYPVS